MDAGRDLSGPAGPGRRWPGRYGASARWYDLLSGEWPVYGIGRRAGIELLDPRPGEHVLDVGCGTGLNFALLQAAVGPAGRITGVDASADMLARASARIQRHGWRNVRLVHADAGIAPGSGGWADPPVDAVLFTYALSVIPGWRQALETAAGCARPGARLVVVDLALPDSHAGLAGPAAAALARLACLAGGSDPRRHPWTALPGRLRELRHRTYRRGHIHVVGGRLP